MTTLKLRAFYLFRSALELFPVFAVGFTLTMILGLIYLSRVQ